MVIIESAPYTGRPSLVMEAVFGLLVDRSKVPPPPQSIITIYGRITLDSTPSTEARRYVHIW